MRRKGLSLLVFGLVVPLARADDKPATAADPATQALASLVQEFTAEQQRFLERIKAAQELASKSGVPPRPIRFEEGPALEFSARFLALAEKHAGAPAAFEAICLALNTSGGPSSTAGTWNKAITLLKDHYATKPEIKLLLRPLGAANDASAEGLIHEVMAKNPDRKLQALACRSLATARQHTIDMVEQIKNDAALRKSFESVRGKPYIDKLLADQEKNIQEAAQLKKALREKYADVIADLSVGRPAPEIVINDIDGKQAKLSAHQGKVVVLDIWATWCGPCRAMIPHEREMVERLKDKPFALISISVDDKLETLKEFLSKEKMPWVHWWNGSQGGVVDDYGIEYFPTIYVLDAKGVIRYKDVREKELEEAVTALIKETETPKAR